MIATRKRVIFKCLYWCVLPHLKLLSVILIVFVLLNTIWLGSIKIINNMVKGPPIPSILSNDWGIIISFNQDKSPLSNCMWRGRGHTYLILKSSSNKLTGIKWNCTYFNWKLYQYTLFLELINEFIIFS